MPRYPSQKLYGILRLVRKGHLPASEGANQLLSFISDHPSDVPALLDAATEDVLDAVRTAVRDAPWIDEDWNQRITISSYFGPELTSAEHEEFRRRDDVRFRFAVEKLREYWQMDTDPASQQ
jgi:hypothetical protein